MTDLTGQEKTDNEWRKLAALTPARIALGRSGSGLPTHEVLKFALAHAQARDAVHTAFDPEGLAAKLGAIGLDCLMVMSAAHRRGVYLRRPDLGRRLNDESRQALADQPAKRPDLAIVIADGLSSTAIETNAQPLLEAFLPFIKRMGLSTGPVIIASEARVALGDDVGETLGARMVLLLVGERPGLSSPDSLGAYLTFAPKTGRTDAERNCISNIRPGGISYEAAAFKLGWLIDAAFTRGLTGVSLKDESASAYLAYRQDNPPALAG